MRQVLVSLTKHRDGFLGGVGLLIGLAAIFAEHRWIFISLLALATAMGVSLVASYVLRAVGRTQIEAYPAVSRWASLDDLEAVYQLDKAVFKKCDVISLDTFVEWHQTNPRIFKVFIVDERLVGYYAVLPLRPSVLDEFVQGNIKESDFRGDSILEPNDAKELRRIYLFSIARDPGERGRGYEIVADAAQYLGSGEDYPNIETLYATGATEDGVRLLMRRGFRRVMDAGDRADEHPLFEIHTTSEHWTAPPRGADYPPANKQDS